MPAYDDDFYAWAHDQIRFLREGRIDLLDIEHLTSELSKIAKAKLQVHVDRTVKLLVHLFRWRYLPNERTDGLRAMIEEERSAVLEGLQESPSFSNTTDEPSNYQLVWERALSEVTTESQRDYFPDECPWPIDDVLSRGWLPSVDESGTGG